MEAHDDIKSYPFPSIGIEDVEEARKRISAFVHVTPILTSSYVNKLAGKEIFFKCELFQKMGAFKFRGACNAVMRLDDNVKGTVTHSSGNHGQAVALASQLRGIKSTIVIPKNAPAIKIQACQTYGAGIELCEPTQESREGTALRIANEQGSFLIHPFNNLDVIAGQGTMALEILEQVADLDAIVAPVGGGGMISGICIAAKGKNPNIRIFAAEPKGADDTFRSKKDGKLTSNNNITSTVADGLRTNVMGDLTWPIVRDKVDEVFTVTEEEIKAAMRIIWERMKLVIEPSAAVGVAAILSEEFKKLPVKRVAVILCGGNVDLDTWKWN
eukprot:TRINITY_DN3530_c0_g1_i2.p1 TRINITY_DN3530_c0_g1~~TRINITY_DN3530_c0_g1_i2.p1  ORF type:complete len:328 (+),score=51.55 TRINITY_DN3530_c0_g1_i2:227-1210(+)